MGKNKTLHERNAGARTNKYDVSLIPSDRLGIVMNEPQNVIDFVDEGNLMETSKTLIYVVGMKAKQSFDEVKTLKERADTIR